LHDVIVVGGGPVGSQTAYRLSGAGHSVLVLEKKPGTMEPVCCTGIISQDCVQTFDIDNNVILHRLKSARLFSPGNAELCLQRPEIQASVVDRGAFDNLIARRAQIAGPEFCYSFRVDSIDSGRDFVTVQATHQQINHTFRSRSVVIAAGHGAIPTTKPDAGEIEDFTVGAQAEVMAEGINEVEVYLGRKYAPGFFAWLVPSSPGKALAGTMARHNTAGYLKELLQYLAKQGKIRSADVPLGARTIPLRRLSKISGRRLIIAGSAAGQVKPITGGGIYYGMLCAEIAAQTLHRALSEDDFSAAKMSDYARGCNNKLGEEIKISSRIQKIIERLNDRQLDKIFEIAGSDGLMDSLLKMNDLSFDWHGQAIKRLVRQKALSGIWQMMKVSFN